MKQLFFTLSALIPVLLVILLSSCREFAVTEVDEDIFSATEAYFSRVVTPNVEDPGEVHNEILAEFEKRHPMSGGREISKQRFAQLFAEAANEVLRRRRIDMAYGTYDILMLLRYFDQYKTAGVYDFYGENQSNPENLVRYLHDRKRLSEKAASDLNELFRDFTPTAEVIPTVSSSEKSRESTLYNNTAAVLAASQNFWSQRIHPLETGPGAKSDGGPKAVDWYALGILGADATGVIVVEVLTGGGGSITVTIAATLASAAFICAVTGDGGDSGGDGRASDCPDCWCGRIGPCPCHG